MGSLSNQDLCHGKGVLVPVGNCKKISVSLKLKSHGMNCATKKNDPMNLTYSFLYECVEGRYFIGIQLQPLTLIEKDVFAYQSAYVGFWCNPVFHEENAELPGGSWSF